MLAGNRCLKGIYYGMFLLEKLQTLQLKKNHIIYFYIRSCSDFDVFPETESKHDDWFTSSWHLFRNCSYTYFLAPRSRYFFCMGTLSIDGQNLVFQNPYLDTRDNYNSNSYSFWFNTIFWRKLFKSNTKALLRF